jgi:sporulation protein YlmC with PRC-barrel domain
MRYDYRMVAAAVIVAAAGVAAAGLSAAGDVDQTQSHQRVAQAAVTDSAPARAGAETTSTVIDKEDVQAILGRQVLSNAGEDMGRVIDIVVDRSGQVRAAVIDFGGFLGVGNRKVAIDWNALHFAPTGSREDRITLDLTREQVKAAPEYRDGAPLIMLGAADSVPAAPP